MKKYFLILGIILSVISFSKEKEKITKVGEKAKSVENVNEKNEDIMIKTFSTLEDAAYSYVEVMQLATDTEALGNIGTINSDVDNYVINSGDNELLEKWVEVNIAIQRDVEYKISNVKELSNLGEVEIVIVGYDKDEIKKYMEQNSSEYQVLNNETKENEISVEAYVDLLYNYLLNTEKIELGTAKIDFVKGKDGWKIIKKNN